MIKAIAIFILQIIYVPLLTLRTTFVIKGEKIHASILALLEAIIYIISLGIVFSDLKNLYNIVAYISGYGLGIYLGGFIEEKLAFGYRCVHVIVKEKNLDLIKKLRDLKFGVTTYVGEGINSECRYRIEVISHRSREKELISTIYKIDPSAFIVSYEITEFKGGFLVKQPKK
ncbi:DUF2179 domain-containing protein [Clostridium tarantellae]|uniref:UPF0316 protein GBZ86_16475 n=1 Tax=Clostridium tarantellae TaxID=39493 RepID=A0A6I1MX01_9CLOT|nr:DUF2179 domain-containing protein [Clostridium tarantellae]